MHLADVTAPARGAFVTLDALIALRFPARQLQLSRRQRALNALTGPNKSNFRGRGIDFAEVRNYQAGDDIRTIDWRVTARTGEAHTKLFTEERERPVLVVVDQRNSLFFGSSHCFKSVLAAQLGALVAWGALQGGDRVGGLVFNDVQHTDLRPKRSRKTVLALLSHLNQYNTSLPLEAPTSEDSFAAMLAKLRRIARPGSNVFLISDFYGATTDTALEHLFQLAQHTQITAISCSDPLEAQLPPAGRYAVTNGQQRSELQTADARLRQRYEREFATQQDALSQSLRRLGIPLLHSETHRPPFALLQEFYGSRQR
tara:strand:+ start:124060 stop:125001 length:942 start_codon:yes stop_codon:yes gene_type:complete